MSMQEIATETVIDLDSDEEAIVIVRARDGAVALALSLLSDGDVELFLSVEDAERVTSRLVEAIAIASARRYSDPEAG